MKKSIEWLLFNSDISNYQISKATGIGQNVLSNYAIGKSDIGNMSLDNAIKLYDYFNGVLSKMENQFGSVVFEGKEFILTQEAYIDGTHENPLYRAHAIDADGYEYCVYWDVVDGYERMDDASDHCDWDRPHEVVTI